MMAFMVWLVGSVLAVLVLTAGLGGVHAGVHGMAGPIVALVLGGAWAAAAAGEGAASGTAWWLAGTSAACALVSLLLTGTVLRSRGTPPQLREPEPGQAGRAVTDLDPTGVVQLGGESWTAESVSGTVARGTEIRVVSRQGVRLRVWADQVSGVPLVGDQPSISRRGEEGEGP